MTTTKKNWLSKQTFKKLANELRVAEGRHFERTALPYFRLVFGDVRQASPRLDQRGIDLVMGDDETEIQLVVQCKSSVERIALPQQLALARESIGVFRDSGLRTAHYIFLFNREEETVSHREALQSDSRDLERLGVAQKAEVWSHHDLLNAAFNAMQSRVLRWIEVWNGSFRNEQQEVEAVIGSQPLTNVPFDEYELRIDAARLRETTTPRRSLGDPLGRLTAERRRKIRLLLGDAGMGKTTTIARAAVQSDRQWLVIRADRIRNDIASSHALFETALDVEDLVADAVDADRHIWLQIVGPVLKYLTQFDSGIGIIVDALDEAPALQSSIGLQRFFNLFRRAVVPIIVTMRTDFWQQRRTDFETELNASSRESTVQTLEVLELAPWPDELIADAANHQLQLTREPDAGQRIAQFIDSVRSGNANTEYGDVLGTPLLLRFILDLLVSEQATGLSRRELVMRWARLKVVRDVEAPARLGGGRMPIATGVMDSEETVRRSFAAMRVAARCMSEIVDGELRLRPYCAFEEIEASMGRRAPQNALALMFNSLLVSAGSPRDDGTVHLRFAHRLFHEFFLADDLIARGIDSAIRVPDEVRVWLPEGHSYLASTNHPDSGAPS